jgi:quinol monooxygenase YgiN
MDITRINEFLARPGKDEALRTLLTSAIPMIATCSGCVSCHLLQSHENPTRFVVLEVWSSIESHQAAMGNIPAEALTELMELVDSAPRGEYYVRA